MLERKTQELLIGLTLGDAHVGISGNDTFITMEQSIIHRDYVLYLHNLLLEENLPLEPVKYYSRIDTRYDNINESVYFKCSKTTLLNFLSEMFIHDGKKIIPINIANWLTPISLAHWICGDGQLVKDGGITLCTDNYSVQEVEILIAALKNKFNAKCSIHYKKGKSGNIYHRIYIWKNSFNSIKPLIKGHVHESFLYKLHL